MDVRTRGLTVLFDIVKTYGDQFEAHWWKDLFQATLKLIERLYAFWWLELLVIF